MDVIKIKQVGSQQIGGLTERSSRVRGQNPVFKVPDAIPDAVGHLTHAEWPDLAAEEQQLLESAANILAKRGVAEAAGSIDEDWICWSPHNLNYGRMDHTGGRCIEWVGLLLPSLDLDNDRERILGRSDSTV